MTAAQLNIFVSLSALEPLPDGEERCRVPYEWSINGFGLRPGQLRADARGFQSKDGV